MDTSNTTSEVYYGRAIFVLNTTYNKGSCEDVIVNHASLVDACWFNKAFTDDGVHEVDISGLSGSYYIQLQSDATRKTYITKVWLEKGGDAVRPYQEITYIEGTGSQVINSGISPSEYFKLEIAISNYTNASSVSALAGVEQTSSSGFYSLSTNNSPLSVVVGESVARNTTIAMDSRAQTIIVDCENTELTISSGSDVFTYARSGSITGSRPVYIFANNSYYYPSYSYNSKFRLYSLKITKDGNLVRDFVPCYLTANVTDYWGNPKNAAEIGLWDVVSNKFFPNNGSGVFIAGDPVPPIPRDGLQVEWLFDEMTSSVVTDTSGNNNNGAITGTITQEAGYIGYSGRCSVNNTTNKVTCPMSASAFSASFWFKSNYTSTSQLDTNTQMVGIMAINGYYCQMYATRNGTAWYCDAGDNSNNTGLSTTDNTWHHIVITHGSSWGLYIDGVPKTAAGYYVASVNEGIALFNNRGALNQSGNVNIDQFRFYNRVLTASEVVALYHEKP